MQQLNYVWVILAIFSASLLIINVPVKIAHAQSFSLIDGFAYPIKAMHYQSDNDLIWILTASSSTSATVLYWVDRATLSVIGSFNHTVSVSAGAGNKAQDIWCGKTDCFITTANTAGSDGQLLRISTETLAPDIFIGQNVTGTYTHATGGLHHLTGRDSVNGGFGSITMWVNGCNDEPACNTEKIYIIDGISMTTAGALPQADSSSQTKSHGLAWSGIEGSTDNYLVEVRGGVSAINSNELNIYNLATLATVCGNTNIPSAFIPFGVAVNFVEAGSADNKIYVSSEDGKVYVYDDSCNLVQSITALQTGLSNDVRFIEYSSGRIFMQESGANALISQMLTNSTGHIITTDNTIYFPQPSVSQSVFDSTFTTVNFDDMILFAGNGKLWYPYSGSEQEVGILTYDAELGGGEAEEACFDINTSPLVVQLLCLEDTDGDGIPDGSSSVVWRAGKNVTSISNDFMCNIGILADADSDGVCDNYDVKTNGVGYIITIFLFAFMIVLFAIAKLKTNLGIPEWFWIIGTFAVIGAGIGFGWMDLTLLVIGIIVMVGMASFRIYSMIQGRFRSSDE